MQKFFRHFLIIVSLILINGCGGGKGSRFSPPQDAAVIGGAPSGAPGGSSCYVVNGVIPVNEGSCSSTPSPTISGGSPPVPGASQSPTSGTGSCSAQGPASSDNVTWGGIAWIKTDDSANGSDFNLGWRGDHAVINGCNQLVMTIDTDNGACAGACSGRPYAGGQLQSASTYSYGTYQIDMKTSNASGTVTTFFTYIDPTGNGTNDEIDVEIPGERSTTLEATYYVHGGAGIEQTVNLGFDSSAAFHTYAIQWLPNAINWIVDGKIVLTAPFSNAPSASLPTVPPYFMINFWTGVPSWLGPFNYTGPVQAIYQNPKFTPAS